MRGDLLMMFKQFGRAKFEKFIEELKELSDSLIRRSSLLKSSMGCQEIIHYT